MAAYDATLDDVAADHLGRAHRASPPRLYRNRGDVFHNALFLNPGHGQRHLTVRLVGRRSNRMAVGARIKVVLDTPAGPRPIHRAVGSVSSFGGSPLRQEIGLGQASAIRLLEVRWPASGTRQVFRDLQPDRAIRVVEGRDSHEPLPAPAYDLGRVADGETKRGSGMRKEG